MLNETFLIRQELNNYKRCNMRFKEAKSLLEACYENMGLLQAVDYSKVSVLSSPSPEMLNCVENAAVQQTEYTAKYSKAFNQLINAERILLNMASGLNELDRALIIDRYLSGVKITVISKKYGYDMQVLYNKYRDIYIKISKKIKTR